MTIEGSLQVRIPTDKAFFNWFFSKMWLGHVTWKKVVVFGIPGPDCLFIIQLSWGYD